MRIIFTTIISLMFCLSMSAQSSSVRHDQPSPQVDSALVWALFDFLPEEEKEVIAQMPPEVREDITATVYYKLLQQYSPEQLDSMKALLSSAPPEFVDYMKADAQESAEDDIPSFQGVKIDGTVEDLATKFKSKGWEYLALHNLTEKELRAAGSSLEEFNRDVIVMEGHFRQKDANLILKPISDTDRRVVYAGLGIYYDEYSLQKFIDYDLMPLVKEYAAKYGDYEITEASERYKNAGKYDSKYTIGPSNQLVSFSFADSPMIMLRAQTDENSRFEIVIHYINFFNYSIQRSAENYYDDI